MGDYKRTPIPNLVRHRNGVYYLRARFGGGPVRESLGTSKYQAARDRLAVRLDELRGAGQRAEDAPESLGQAVAMVRNSVAQDPSLKASTRASYAEQLGTLLDGPAKVPSGELRRLTAIALRQWWMAVAKLFAPQRANHLLMWVRRALARARKLGGISRDPAEDLKPVKIPRRRLTLLTGAQFRALIADVRKKRNRHDPHQAGDWLEFMAYCGLRPGEIAALRWEDIDEREGILTVRGGKEGTKNRKVRRVPMSGALLTLVKAMRKRRGEDATVFQIKTPVFALRNGCRRLGLPHQRLYDLRHSFATACAKSGVDVATFSGWLGHSDGGTLALKTYVHPDEAHGKEAAKKVRF